MKTKEYARNRKATFNAEIEKKLEVGIVLDGSEVKAVRNGRISLKDAYVKIKNGEMFLMQAHISKPDHLTGFVTFEEKRPRKLLAHKNEILKLKSLVDEKKYIILPLKVYQPENSGKIKVQIGIGKPKKTYDKKQTIKERDLKRESDRILKNY